LLVGNQGATARSATAPHYYSERGISMTDQIAYQEYIQRRYNAFCKTVIRCAALDKILKLKRQWERQVSLDYLMNEKFVQFAASEPDEEYPFTVCGQTVLLCNAALADAISVLPEQTREEILRYCFLRQPQRVIGACIGRSRSTAGRHIQLALQRLREEMGVSRFEYPPPLKNNPQPRGGRPRSRERCPAPLRRIYPLFLKSERAGQRRGGGLCKAAVN